MYCKTSPWQASHGLPNYGRMGPSCGSSLCTHSSFCSRLLDFVLLVVTVSVKLDHYSSWILVKQLLKWMVCMEQQPLLGRGITSVSQASWHGFSYSWYIWSMPWGFGTEANFWMLDRGTSGSFSSLDILLLTLCCWYSLCSVTSSRSLTSTALICCSIWSSVDRLPGSPQPN